MAEPPIHLIERYKSIFDYLKHLTTLSTGSIILISAFLEKLFVKPNWKFLVAIALGSFMTSVVAAVVTHTILAFDFPGDTESPDLPKWANKLGDVSLVTTWTGFLVGIISLAIFCDEESLFLTRL